jgi:4-amino-4-deoxy-L-arabinose transferase-like glycosyltransferase
MAAALREDLVAGAQFSSRKKDLYAVLLLGVIFVPLFFVSTCFRDLWSPDEPRYAAISREMIETGNWVLPRLNQNLYSEKPPLHFWVTAISAQLWGSYSTPALLFPSLLAAMGCLIVTYFFGKRLFNANVGLISSLVLGTSLLFLGMAQILRMDMLLTFFLASAFFSFYRAYDRSQGSAIYYLIFYLLLALTFLTKGPVGIFLTFLVVTFYLAWKRDLKSLWKLRPFTGLLVIMIIVGPWLIASVRQGGWEYLQALIIKQNLVRAYDSWDHDQPFYFYLLYLPAIFFPWFSFFIGALIYQIRLNRRGQRCHGSVFLILWFTTLFIFFSLMSGKVAAYMLPLTPAASILVAQFWHNGILNQKADRSLSLTLSASAYALWFANIILGGIILFGLRLKMTGVLDQWISIPFFCFGVLGLGLWRLDRKKAALITIMIFPVALTAFSIWSLIPAVNARSSLSPLGNTIASLRQNNEKVGMYNCDRPSLYFYTGDQIAMLKSKKEVVDFISSNERVLCVLEEVQFRKLAKRLSKKGLPNRVNWLASVEQDGKKLVIVSQYPQ